MNVKVDIASLNQAPAVPTPVSLPVCDRCRRSIVPGLYIERDEAIVLWQGHYLPVTRAEHRVLLDLVSNAPKVRRLGLMHNVLRRPGNTRPSLDPAGSVRAVITRIRRKFRAVDPTFDRIRVMPASGYRWADGHA